MLVLHGSSYAFLSFLFPVVSSCSSITVEDYGAMKVDGIEGEVPNSADDVVVSFFLVQYFIEQVYLVNIGVHLL